MYNVIRHCVPNMVAGGYGRIINISSVNGERGQFGQTNYSAAKAGTALRLIRFRRAISNRQ